MSQNKYIIFDPFMTIESLHRGVPRADQAIWFLFEDAYCVLFSNSSIKWEDYWSDFFFFFSMQKG
jgi:hypothetical protein